MSIPLRASVAQIVAKLLAQRVTPQDEVPDLVHSVHVALSRIAEPGESEHAAASAVAAVAPEPRQPRQQRQRRIIEAEAPAEEAVAAAPPPPRLLRRADVVATTPPPTEPMLSMTTPGGILRGVVKWFDLRTRRGALRLPGCSGDVPVEPALLDEMAIPRLYKGQEVDATLAVGETPRLVRLALPGGAWQVHSVGGVVRARQAKPVVVELKREALRRVAARAEAELLLGPSRSR
jgi:hypothetical protein